MPSEHSFFASRKGFIFVLANIIGSIVVGCRLFDLLRMMHTKLGISQFGAFIIFCTFISMSCFALSIFHAYFKDIERYEKDKYLFCCISISLLCLLLIFFLLNGALSIFFSQTASVQSVCCVAIFLYVYCCISTIILHKQAKNS